MAEIIVLDEIKTSAKHGIVTRTERVADSDGKTLDTIISEIDAKASSASVTPMTSGVSSTAPNLAGLKINNVEYKIPEGGSTEVVEFSFEEEVKKLKTEIKKTDGLIPAGALLNQLNAFVPGAHSITADAAGYLYQFMHFYFDCEQASMDYENPTKLMMQVTAEEYSHYNVIHKKVDRVEYKGFSYEWQDRLVSVLMNITFTASPFNMQVIFDCVESAPTIVEANPTDIAKFSPSGTISKIGIGNKLYTFDSSKVTCTTNADGTLKTIKVDGDTYNLPADVITSVNGKTGEVELTGSDIKLKDGSVSTIAAKIDSIDSAIANKSKVVAKSDEAGNLKQIIVDGETYNVPEGGEGGDSAAGSEVVATDDTDGYLKKIKVDGVEHNVKPIPEENVHIVSSIPSSIKENHLYITKGGVIHHEGETTTETIYDNPVYNEYTPGDDHGVISFGYFHYAEFKRILDLLPRHPNIEVESIDMDGTTVYAVMMENLVFETHYTSYCDYCEAVLGKSFADFTDEEVAKCDNYEIYSANKSYVDETTLSISVGEYKIIGGAFLAEDDAKITFCVPQYYKNTSTNKFEYRSVEFSKDGITFGSKPAFENTTKLTTVFMTDGDIGAIAGAVEFLPGFQIGYDLGCKMIDYMLEGKEPEFSQEVLCGKDYIPVYGKPLNAASTPAALHSQIPDFIAVDGTPIGQIGTSSGKWNGSVFRAGKSNITIIITPAYDEVTKPSIKIGVKSGDNVTLNEYGNVFVVNDFPTSNLVEGNIYIKSATGTTNTEIKIVKKVNGVLTLGVIGGDQINIEPNVVIPSSGERSDLSTLKVGNNYYSISVVKKHDGVQNCELLSSLTINGTNYRIDGVRVYNSVSSLPSISNNLFPPSNLALVEKQVGSETFYLIYAYINNAWVKISDESTFDEKMRNYVYVDTNNNIYISGTSYPLGDKTFVTKAFGDNLATSHIGANLPSEIPDKKWDAVRCNHDTQYLRILNSISTQEKQSDGTYKETFWDLPLTLGTTADVNSSTNELRSIHINGVTFSVGNDRQDYDMYPDVQSMPEGHIINLTRDVIDPLSVDEHITDPACIWLAPDWRTATIDELSCIFNYGLKWSRIDNVYDYSELDLITVDRQLFKDAYYGGRRSVGFEYVSSHPLGEYDVEIPSKIETELKKKLFIRPNTGFVASKDDSTKRRTDDPGRTTTGEMPKRTGNITAYNYYRQIGSAQEMHNVTRMGSATCWTNAWKGGKTDSNLFAKKLVYADTNVYYDFSTRTGEDCNQQYIKTVADHTGEPVCAVCDVIPDETAELGFRFENPSAFTQSLRFGIDYLVFSFTPDKRNDGSYYSGTGKKTVAVYLRNVGAKSVSDPGFYFQYGDRFPSHYANPNNTKYSYIPRRMLIRDTSSPDFKRHVVTVDMYNGGDYSHRPPIKEFYVHCTDYNTFYNLNNGYLVKDFPCDLSIDDKQPTGTLNTDWCILRLRNFKDDPTATYTTIPKGRYQVVKDTTTGLKKLERLYTFNKDQYDKIMALIAD